MNCSAQLANLRDFHGILLDSKQVVLVQENHIRTENMTYVQRETWDHSLGRGKGKISTS